jgi:hypothetical protein
VQDNYKVVSEGYSRLSLSSTLHRYISLSIVFDQLAQLVPGSSGNIYFQLTFYINFTYTLLFFLLLHILYQSTFFTNLESKKKSRGDYFFYFFCKKVKVKKKYEK